MIEGGGALPFTGRHQELDTLRQVLRLTAGGQGGIAMLRGAPGIGKTRLAGQLAQEALEQRFLVLRGTASPLDVSLSYAPLLEALDPVMRSPDRTRRDGWLQGLSPLKLLWAALPLPEPPYLGDPALEKRRLLDAITRLLERIAQTAPVLLILDDLQWADSATLQLVHHLERGISRMPLLLLGTCRDEVVSEAPDLGRWLASLKRTAQAEVISLEPLSGDEVASLLQVRLHGTPSTRLLETLLHQSGGVPLFLGALLETLESRQLLTRNGEIWSLRTSRVPLPENIREVVIEQLERLEPADRELTEWIALCHDGAPLQVLREVTGRTADELVEPVCRLMRQGLLVEQQRGGHLLYTFPHVLTAQAVVSTLPQIVRHTRHARLAAAVDRHLPTDLQRQVHHYRSAGESVEARKAMAVLAEGGRRALQLSAFREAGELMKAAIDAARRGGCSRDLPELLEHLGSALLKLGDVEQVLVICEEALRLYRDAGHRKGTARVLSLRAHAELQRLNLDATLEYLRQAMDVLEGDEEDDLRTNLHHDLLRHMARLGDREAYKKVLYGLHGLSPRSRMIVCSGAMCLALAEGRHAEVRELGGQATRLAEACAEPPMVAHIRVVNGFCLFSMGDLPAAVEQASISLWLNRELEHSEGQAMALFLHILADWAGGRWEEALRRAEQIDALRQVLSGIRPLVRGYAARALVYACRGDQAGARAALDRIWSQLQGTSLDAVSACPIRLSEALLALELGDPAAALEALGKLPPECGVEGRDLFFPTLILWARGQALVGTGRLDEAADIGMELRRRDGEGSYCGALADFIEGLVLERRLEPEAAAERLLRAFEVLNRLGFVFEAAHAQHVRLELASRISLSPREVQAAAVCITTFERLGALGRARAARALLSSLGSRLPTRSRGEALLSGREQEIAALVVQGLTNDEVGARLFISPLTVGAHLKRIYARLGVHSRAELVRTVLERRLIERPLPG